MNTEIKKVICLDGTSYTVGKDAYSNIVKSIYLKQLAKDVIQVFVYAGDKVIHIPYHAVLLYIEE